jgi:arginine decarboxylase
MRTSKERAPIYEMLEAHAAKRPISFHVPGHKGRTDWGVPGADQRYGPLMSLDVTELTDTDDLHHPQGPIAEAQHLAADCFGADETQFLVGGSTAGNLAMILGTAAPGELLITQRNVHRSVIHALMLAGVQAVLLPPAIDISTGLALIPEENLIEQTLARYPEAKGVILTSPNYYGLSTDLRPIVERCHAAGIPVLVDEAHGPHYGMHPLFPQSALQAGADVVVQSAHKMLNAMTMGAMLHMQGKRVVREAVLQALRMVQSSSPSFPLLASLDLARRRIHTEGPQAFEAALSAARRIRQLVSGTRFRILHAEAREISDGVRYDPLKVVCYDEWGQWDGFAVRDLLAARGCHAEMADARFVVLALGIGSTYEDGEAAGQALAAISKELGAARSAVSGEHAPLSGGLLLKAPQVPEPVRFDRQVKNVISVPLEEAVGRTAGEWIVPYPPGIPELFPGERVTVAAIERLKQWNRKGAQIQGAGDPTLSRIRVWD